MIAIHRFKGRKKTQRFIVALEWSSHLLLSALVFTIYKVFYSQKNTTETTIWIATDFLPQISVMIYFCPWFALWLVLVPQVQVSKGEPFLPSRTSRSQLWPSSKLTEGLHESFDLCILTTHTLSTYKWWIRVAFVYKLFSYRNKYI
jgi:hypothetical protein